MQVVGHWCRWLNVTLTHVSADFARSQRAAGRMGRQFQEVLSMLCHKWPLRWDHYVLPASWIQRVTPETSLSANMAPFRILVGRDARTRIDTMTLSIDEGEFRGGFDNFEVDKLEAFMEVRDALDKRQAGKDKARDALNAQVGRGLPGRYAKVEDLVMVKEADSSSARQGMHLKLSHDHWTAPWKVVSILRPGSSLVVNLNGRSIRGRAVSVANVKPFYLRPVDLRHEFEDEFAHAAWGADLGLAEASTAASPVYTLLDHKAVQGMRDTWSWEYRGRYEDGVESQWLTEDEVKDSFTLLQLDAFHAM